jgi:bilirubin oxidase
MVGMYQITDPADKANGLPSGDETDVPLVLTSHYFTKDGLLSNETKQQTSIYGDVFLVNGAMQPFLSVGPKLYRLRILNAAVSRTFNLTLLAGDAQIPMSVIGSDGGYRKPADIKSLVISMAERYEILVDFSRFAGQTLMLRTTNTWTDTAYMETDDLMQINVSAANTSDHRKSISRAWTTSLSSDSKFPANPKIAATRNFKLDSHMDMLWGINGLHHDDPMSRVLLKPALGTIDKITFQSNGMGRWTGGKLGSADPSLRPAEVPAIPADHGHHGRRQMMGHGEMAQKGDMSTDMSNAAWTHAMHLHLADVKLISRRKQDPAKAEGRDYLEEYEKDAVKDVVVLGSNEIVEVLAKYAPYPGMYMMHCHNEIHEDKGMMGIFNITRLQDFGYSDLDAKLEDPMDTRFNAKPWNGTDLDQVKREVLPFFSSLKAYPDLKRIEELEEKYWGSHEVPKEETKGAASSGGMSGMGGMHGSGGSGMNMTGGNMAR